MPLRVVLRADLNDARKARDPDRVALLRTLISAIENAEAIDASTLRGSNNPTEMPRRTLSDEDIMNIVLLEGQELRSAADEYERLGQAEEAIRLRSLSLVADRYAEEMSESTHPEDQR